MPFFGKYHQRIQHFENEFMRKLHEKFGPIGWEGESWFFLWDPHTGLVEHHNFLLIFSSHELAYDFLSSIEVLMNRRCLIQSFTWQSIEDFCLKRNLFSGAVADFIVREDFTFHGFKSHLA